MSRAVRMCSLLVVSILGGLGCAAGEDSKSQKSDDKVPKNIAVDLGCGVKLEMLLIPSGEFLMGSPNDDGREKQHRVRITKPFYMGVYPVTQEQWEAVMGNNPSRCQGVKNPVESVDWQDCQDFFDKLNAREREQRGKFVLPTEAQWEYACRAGSTTRYSFGDDAKMLGEYAWYIDNAESRVHPVGQKKPNAWGVYDMHGNVQQWCQDWYKRDYYAKSPVDDPQGPLEPEIPNRVVRGGSISVPAKFCGSAVRASASPWLSTDTDGFRACLIPKEGGK